MVQQRSRTVLVPDLEYPESDGKPLADNTIQFGLMMKIQGGLDALFDDQAVFVAGDLLWYPVQGSLTRQAPDVMVVFGRPKGDRGSYKQWEEDNIPPQVVFEILSPGNTRKEMEEKLKFYERYGVEEYYLYDPLKNILKGWIRAGGVLTAIVQTERWISPRLGIRFETQTGTLELYKPNGDRFESFVEITKRADQEAQRAQQADQRADQEAQRAQQADQRAQQEAQRAEQAIQSRYAAIDRLLALGLSEVQVAEALGFSVEEVKERS
jgi:Uma2 family endonuclease